jgi:peptidoglycan/LPS O-acetylase OafA/YrhL
MQPEVSGKKYAGLDHLRALAITLVFLCHYRMFNHPEWVNNIGEFGWIGVDLFFVLSGFLIAGQLFSEIRQQKPLQIKVFYLKRFFRIIPAYLFVLTLYFTVPSFKETEGLAPLWKYLTFTQNFGLDLSSERAFSHAWSLCIEEQFYLLLPFVVLFFAGSAKPGRAFYLVLALFIGGFAVRIYSWLHFIAPVREQDGLWFIWYKWIYYPTYTRLDGLLAGICIAGVFQFRPQLKERITKHGNKFLLLSIVLLAGAYFLYEDASTFAASVFGYPLIAIAFGAMVIAALSPSCFLYRAGARFTGIIATLSYSIYLSHKGVVHVTQYWISKWGFQIDENWMMLICIISTILAGFLMHHIIEKPFLKLRDKVLVRNTKAIQATAVEDEMKKAG